MIWSNFRCARNSTKKLYFRFKNKKNGDLHGDSKARGRVICAEIICVCDNLKFRGSDGSNDSDQFQWQ